MRYESEDNIWFFETGFAVMVDVDVDGARGEMQMFIMIPKFSTIQILV